MALFLVREERDNWESQSLKRICMPLNLAILMFLFCENDNRVPGVFKLVLYHAEFEKNKSKWTVA